MYIYIMYTSPYISTCTKHSPLSISILQDIIIPMGHNKIQPNEEQRPTSQLRQHTRQIQEETIQIQRGIARARRVRRQIAEQQCELQHTFISLKHQWTSLREHIVELANYHPSNYIPDAAGEDDFETDHEELATEIMDLLINRNWTNEIEDMNERLKYQTSNPI